MKTTSINLTVHNKESIIADVIHAIGRYTTGKYELVVCFDGCTDNSEAIARQQLASGLFYGVGVKIIHADNVFETKANNLTAKSSTGDNLIFVQDDMIVSEEGWNKRLLLPIEEFHDVFAVTARTAHNWVLNPNSNDAHADRLTGSAQIRSDCWSDILFHCDHADEKNTPRDFFAIRSTVNRGPLAVVHSDMQSLGYFDECYAPLSFDDHDLMFRAHQKLGKVCGYYGISWYSQPGWGGTRNADGSTRPFMYEADHKNSRIFRDKYGDILHNCRTCDIRSLSYE